MTKHDPESAAAAFVAGALGPRARTDFEAHLMSCDACWQEVQAGRAGRAIAERGREVTPAALRDRMRSVLAGEAPRRRSRWAAPQLLVAGAAALAAVVLVGAVVVAVVEGRTGQPPAITAAVSGYQRHQLPGSGVPSATPPDLSGLRLSSVAAGAGHLADIAVNAYVYQDSAGRRLVVYVGEQPFPTGRGARLVRGREGPWVLTDEGVTVLCARQPHALLVLSQDAQLVREAADALGVV